MHLTQITPTKVAVVAGGLAVYLAILAALIMQLVA
jgi:hypothetical protein